VGVWRTVYNTEKPHAWLLRRERHKASMQCLTGFLIVISIVFHSLACQAGSERVIYDGYEVNSFAELFSSTYKKNKKFRIQGELHLPQSSGKWPLIILQHGSGTVADSAKWFTTTTDKLNQLGFAVFINDHFSGRNIPRHKQAWLNFPTRLSDNIEAVNILSKDNRIDPNRIGFSGYSYGGMEALYLAYEPIQQLMDYPIGAFLSFYPDCTFMMGEEFDPDIKIIIAGKDDYVNPAHCINWATRNKVSFEVWESAYHGFIRTKPVKKLEKNWTWFHCPEGGIVNLDGTKTYQGQVFQGSEDEIEWEITKLCGTQGVKTGGTEQEFQRALLVTTRFFEATLK